ncbi:MAG: glycosyltransferase, partial [Hyphomicrobiaceae bacterium]
GIIALAVARGRPVVTTPVGGLVEQVRHEASGLIAEHATGDALARCIARLVAEPDLYRSCAEGASSLALHELGWAQLAPAYARLVSKAAQLASDQGSSSSRA